MKTHSFHSDNHYLAIAKFYGDQRAKRSGVLYIQHIDEGLVILEAIGASYEAKAAYCLHPIFQSDEALVDFMNGGGNGEEVVHCYAAHLRPIVLAMEYRRMANSYLSHCKYSDLRRSPLSDVHAMLVADKVQNFKDFLQHHVTTHPRREELVTYFYHWLSILDIREALLQSYTVPSSMAWTIHRVTLTTRAFTCPL